jgi:hypothetical protein
MCFVVSFPIDTSAENPGIEKASSCQRGRLVYLRQSAYQYLAVDTNAQISPELIKGL